MSDDLRYFGPDNHADWCPGDPAHEGPCLDVMLAKVDDDPAPMKPSATIGVTARIRTAKRGRLSEPEPTPSGERRVWHCTTDGVTEPCGDCSGCRYDQQLANGEPGAES